MININIGMGYTTVDMRDHETVVEIEEEQEQTTIKFGEDITKDDAVIYFTAQQWEKIVQYVKNSVDYEDK